MDFSLTEEQRSFRDVVRRWVDAEAPKDWMRSLEADEENYPYALWDKLTEQGFFGIGIPEEYDGLGGDVMMQMIFAREFARTAGGLLWVWGLTSFGGAKTIGAVGTEEQKNRWLRPMAQGQLRVSLSMTEPDGGTDVLGAMKTHAEKVDGGWCLNGAKMWTTGAKAADRLLVLARTDKNVEKKHHGLTMFFVDAKSPGITTSLLPKLGMRAMGSCEVHYEDVFVPDEDVLGEPGQAWYAMLPTLNNERIMVGAVPGRNRRGSGRRARLHEAAQGLRRYHWPVPSAPALRGRYRNLAEDHRVAAQQRRLDAGQRHALRSRGEHAQDGGHGKCREGGGPGYPDSGRHGVFCRNRHAAVLARPSHPAHDADQQ